MTTLPAGWKPIETVPENEGRPMFGLLAFGPEGDQSIGKGFRVNGKWYVGAVFYRLAQEKCYEIREIEVQPTHWMPIPNLPGEESDTTPATTQDAPITVSLDSDPRGVSVGVWQGSHCIYNGAHAVPVAPGDAKDETQELLQELHALVWGECPSLLNEDSGGNSVLDMRIRDAIDAALSASQQQER